MRSCERFGIGPATDANFFAVSTTNGDPGLYSLVGNYSTATGQPAQEVDGGSIANLDPFIEAQSLLEVHGARLNHWFADARTVLALSQLKTFTGSAITSNVPLIHAEAADGTSESDVSLPLVRTINGVVVHALPASAGIALGDWWGIDSTRVFGVVREGVTLATSSELWFDCDAIAIRATTRLSFAFPDPEATVLLSSGGS